MFGLKRIQTPVELKADDAGAVTAVFSTFNVVDKDGDVVLSTALTHGQPVPMTWSHDWSQPVGRGTVRVEEARALFDGHFFLDTSAGQEAYKTVKAMAELQEWSWGFRILDAAWEERDGDLVRVIKRAEVFEVSPVLVGAGENTQTLSVKSNAPYTEHLDAVVRAAQEIIERSQGRVEYRAKRGRVLSQANRDKLTALRDALRSAHDELDTLLAETEPAPEEDDAGKRLRRRARAAKLALALPH